MLTAPRDVIEALNDVKTRVAKAARDHGRNAADTTIIAVTKTYGAERILPVIESGHRDFGENRVQEAEEKWPALKARTSDLRLHLIGALQTNKTEKAVALFDVIHSLDRPKLAEKLATEMRAQNRMLPCFIQVNTGREPQKAGLDPADVEAFMSACRDTWKLNILGLMCIPPVDEEPSLHFAFLRELAARNGLSQLSMGMSDDYEIAVAFGATHVRVGSAIFGPRS